MKTGGILLVLLCLGGIRSAGAQQSRCKSPPEYVGRPVQGVEVVGRWVPDALRAAVAAQIGVGGPLRAMAVADAESTVARAIKASALAVDVPTMPAVGVYFVTAVVCAASDAQDAPLTVVIRPYYIRIDLVKLGGNYLPLPRTSLVPFPASMPGWLRKAEPAAMVLSDDRLGLSAGATVRPRLAQFGAHGATSLGIDLSGQHALQRAFYNMTAGLEAARPEYDGRPAWRLMGDLFANRTPLAAGWARERGGSLNGSLAMRRVQSVLGVYTLGAKLRLLDDTSAVAPGAAESRRELETILQAGTEGRLGNGFARAVVWLDGGWPGNGKPFQRLVARAGDYFRIGNTHNNLGVELLLGAGKAGGDLPDDRRFLAGSGAAGFLYDPPTALDDRGLDGPVLRSFGTRAGGLPDVSGTRRGGSGFLHGNLTLALPFPWLSRPLIPDVAISEDPPLTLRQALKRSSNSAESFIAQDLIDHQGYEPDKADDAASSIVDRDVRPALDFLADRANVYAVKPLILLDMARLSGDVAGAPVGRTWVAVGGGVQMTIVVARLEAAYVHALAPAGDRSSGNFVLNFHVDSLF